MIKKLHSGKFWLQLVFWCSLAWVIIMSIGYAISIWGLSDERIRTSLQKAMPTGRTVHIGSISNKGWLPYPSVTLNNINITYPDSHNTQLHIKQLDIHLAWRSLLGHPHIQSFHVLQPQLTLTRLPNNSWDMDDFYQSPQSAQIFNDLNIVDGILKVQETEHQYHLHNINASVQDWQNTNSQLHLGFNWNSNLLGKQHVNLQGQLQKTATGFKSNNVRIQLDNQLPHIGAVTWLATGQFEHKWLEHRNEFQNIQIKGQDANNTFTAQLSIPQAYWQKIWYVNQTNGVLQWQQSHNTLATATIKLNPTELSSRHFKNDGSSIDILLKHAEDTFSIKAAGHISAHNSGAFSLDNWHISSRQSDANLTNSGLFRTEGLLNVSGNIHDQWQLQWKGQMDNDAVQIDLLGESPEKWQLNVLAQQLELDRYQDWFDTRSDFNLIDNPSKSLQKMEQQVQQWVQTWANLPEQWQLNGNLDIANLRSNQMQLSNVTAKLALNRDLLSLTQVQANAYGGHLNASLLIPRDVKTPNQLQMDVQQMQIQPWLQHWRDYSRLSGTGNLSVNLQTSGAHWDDIQSQLNGDLRFDIKDGMFQGIALDNFLQVDGNPNMQLTLDDQAHTTFDVFKSQSLIADGVFYTKTVDLNLPMGLQLQGSGKYHLPNNKLDYQLKLGQDVLGSKLPVRISGPIQQPNFALDYQGLTQGLTNSTDKSNAVRNALRKQWQLWQMPEFKLPEKP